MNTDAVLLARVSGSLLAVVVLALLAARFARRATRGRRGGDLHVRERVGLTRDTAAVVLETGGRRLLVGVGPTQVTLLADLGSAAPGDEFARVGAPDEGGAEPAAGSEPGSVGEPARHLGSAGVPTPRAPLEPGVRVHDQPLSRKTIRELDRTRRRALPPTQRGTGSVLDPRTWQQGLEALRDLTARRG